jgi:hypothetical protein
MEGFFMITRRTFLAGAGGLITAGLLRNVIGHIRTEGKPMLLAPAKAEETLYAYPYDTSADSYLFTLGPQVDEPPPMTWEAYFRRRGYQLDASQSALKAACAEWGIEPEELQDDADQAAVETEWEFTYCPGAKAFSLLESLDLGPELKGSRGRFGALTFNDCGFPGGNWRWVEGEGLLTVSLLQARPQGARAAHRREDGRCEVSGARGR